MREAQPIRRFNPRAFVSLAMGCSLAALPVTGIANHLLQMEPPWTVQRHAWMSAHNTLGVLFVVFAVWHILLNRSVLASRFRAAARVPAARVELLLALIVVTVTTAIVVSHAFHVP